MDSILNTIKGLLSIEQNDTSFDNEIIVHINSAFMTLAQLGVGPETPFLISDQYGTWTHFLGENTNLEAVKTYIYLSVRLVFDPPSTSFVIDSIRRQMEQLEWRLNVQAESSQTTL